MIDVSDIYHVDLMSLSVEMSARLWIALSITADNETSPVGSELVKVRDSLDPKNQFVKNTALTQL